MKIDELRARCTEYMEVHNLSQVTLAGKIGVAESTFSRWRNGTYPNPESIAVKVETFFNKETARNDTVSVGSVGFAMTTISERVQNVLEYARIQKIIGVVYGDAGIGKTFTALNWMADKPDVVMVTINPTFANPKAFLKILARALRLRAVGASDEVLMGIYDFLSGRDMTIIIDEAQHLTRRTLEIIRSINDSTQTSIVLIGNETVYSKLQGKQQAEFAQLFSRIGMRHNLLTDMFKPKDVRMVFKDYGDSEDDDFAIDYLYKICRSKYGLRGAVYVYTNAKNNDDVTQKGLKTMAIAMGVAL